MKKTIYYLSIVFLSVSLLFSFSLIGCKGAAETTAAETTAAETTAAETTVAETTAAAEKFKVTALCADFSDRWFTFMHQAIEDTAAKYPDIIEVTLVDAKISHETQMAQAENAIAEGADGIILVAVNSVEPNPIVDMCNDAGIPLVTIDRILANQDLADVYVGTDMTICGELSMQGIADMCGGKGNVAIMQGELASEGTIARTQGYLNVMENYPDMKEVVRDTANFKRDEAQTLMENWLQSDLDFNIVMANNSEMAIGAVLGMQSQNVDPTPYYIGSVNGVPDEYDFMKKGWIDVTVQNDPYSKGEQGVQAMIDLLQGKQVDKIVWNPPALVTLDNVDEFIAKWE